MDAVKFTNEARRMCNEYWSTCWGCPAGDGVSCRLGSDYKTISAEEKVSIVERWAAKHPAKTRQSEFLKQWPEALFREGILQICPACVTRSFRGRVGECVVEPKNCQKCKKDFWLAEVEE